MFIFLLKKNILYVLGFCIEYKEGLGKAYIYLTLIEFTIIKYLWVKSSLTICEGSNVYVLIGMQASLLQFFGICSLPCLMTIFFSKITR